MGRKLFEKFRLLMWKNFLIQWRHPTQTAIELLAPVILASLLVVVRSLVDPEPHDTIHYKPFKNKISIMANYPALTNIAWSPKNPKLEAIMKDIVEVIMEDESVRLHDVSFTDSQSMMKYLSNEDNVKVTFVAIEFEDTLAGNKELTPYLNVRIRFPSELRKFGTMDHQSQYPEEFNWNTYRLFPLYQNPGARNWELNEGGYPCYFDEGFLKMQEELTYAIIKHSKSTFDRKSPNISMQRFPYSKWTADPLLTVLTISVGLIFLLSFVYTCVNIVKAITVEKEKQLKEAMKIMGLPNWIHWSAWFVKSLIMLSITMILLVIIMKVKWNSKTDRSIFTQSNPLMLFIFLLFYACATITYCFAISVFFSQASTASSVAGLAWFLSYFPYIIVQNNYDFLTLTQKLLISLCSNSAMGIGFQLVLMFEGTGEGLQLDNMWTPNNPDDGLVMGHILIMLTVDSIIYLIIALYVEAVCPGDYGIPQPWYFPLAGLGLTRRPRHFVTIEDEEDELQPHRRLFEKEPTDLRVGIRIKHLKKMYANKHVAVKDLSLNMYENQITVLLGHNGAGKTTTMSMLTGMIPPTSGLATVDGYNISTQMSSVRNSLGLCPQHNILFDELTVKEHLYFYSKLKGLPEKEITEEVRKYVKLLELVPKANSLSTTLSGGMKRKLSVGVAFCGGSRVVMLDEPTAGMDPTARRALWDLLQLQKTGRTILLTTHFMDEADLLGDRIAIMTGGKLQCSGSSFFLKKKYGAGYHLVLDKEPNCDVNKITQLFQRHIPAIQIESNIGSELTYLLSENQSHIFETLLRDLELNSAQLGVLSYGISLTTLEEVFMKAGAETTEKDGVTINTYDRLKKNMPNPEVPRELSSSSSLNIASSKPKLITGYHLWWNQTLAMFMKRILSIARSKGMHLLQICIPIIFIILAVAIIRFLELDSDLPELQLQLGSYGHTITPLTGDDSHKYSAQFKEIVTEEDMELANWKNGDFSKLILEENEKRSTTVRLKYVGGATFAKNFIIVWFNNEPLHSAPLALQSVLNSILQVELSKNHYIQMYNYPLPYTLDTQMKRLSQDQNVGFYMALNIGFAMALVSPFYLMFYVRERVSKSKHLQFVSGINVVAFWGCSFICDFITFIIISIFVIITLIIFQEEGFRTVPQLGRIFIIFLYFGFSVLPMMYLCSFLFDVPSTGYSKMTLINIFTGMAGFIIVQVFKNPAITNLEHVGQKMHKVLLVIPLYALTSGIRDTYIVHLTIKICDAMMKSCDELQDSSLLDKQECRELHCEVQPKCCSTTRNYYDWEPPGIGRNVTLLLLLGLLLILILMLIEFRICEKIANVIEGRRNIIPPVIDPEEDADVKKERQLVMSTPSEDIRKYTVFLKNVVKFYKKFLAVNNISLTVTKFECFGLLGINGAGKTTTFKIMTGDLKMTHGNAWVKGDSLRTDMKSVQKRIGYCPQFDALLDDLTSRETLRIFCLIRGLSLKESKAEAVNLAEEFDFYPHLDKKVRELSGGNKRKLSTAITLIGNPVVIYLDEPTTGMDPATKRYLWNALCKVRDSGMCIILTSHSMEECEALCTRLAIMVNGKFTCIGSTQHLKSKFSEGYTLMIKVKKERAESDISIISMVGEEMVRIEDFVKRNFPGALKREQHKELVTYYIADQSIPWSRMFGIMEQGKRVMNIEDYSLGQCSLEQVFLTFTKYQRETW